MQRMEKERVQCRKMKDVKSIKKGLAVCLAVSMAATFICGCDSQQIVAENKVHVGVTYYNQSDTFLNELLECFEEDLKDMGRRGVETTVTIRDAAGVQRTQNDQVEELIDAGCDVLCVNLVDRADPSEIIDLARDHDVPIVFFNREPVAEDLLQWDRLYYVGADAEQSGVFQGELASSLIKNDSGTDRNGDGKIQYVILEGEAGHQDAIIRTENAVETMKTNGVELEKLSYQIANWNRAQAQNRMQQLIAQYGDSIELVLANNDDMALGAVDAYEKSGYAKEEYPAFFGIDGTDVGLQAVVDGNFSGTVYNDKEGQAEAMAELAVALVTGDGLQNMEFERGKYIYLPYEKITSENVMDYLDETIP